MRDDGLLVKVMAFKSPRITRISTDYLSFRNKIRENPCDTQNKIWVLSKIFKNKSVKILTKIFFNLEKKLGGG